MSFNAVRIVTSFKSAEDFEEEIQAAVNELTAQGYIVNIQIVQPTIYSIQPFSREYLACVVGTRTDHR